MPPFALSARELNIRAAERAHDKLHDFMSKMQETTVRDAQAAVKSLLLINGGAVVSILAFVGSLARQENTNLSHLQKVAVSASLGG